MASELNFSYADHLYKQLDCIRSGTQNMEDHFEFLKD